MMNLTVLANRLADFNNTMKGIADNLQYFRGLVEKKLAEEEARKGELEAYRNRDRAQSFVAHKGDKLEVIGEFKLPSTDDKTIVGETLEVTNIDALSSKYETTITLFRCDCGIDFTLDLYQIKKLLENDLIKVVEK